MGTSLLRESLRMCCGITLVICSLQIDMNEENSKLLWLAANSRVLTQIPRNFPDQLLDHIKGCHWKHVDQSNQANQKKWGWQCEKKQTCSIFSCFSQLPETDGIQHYCKLISLGLPQFTTVYAKQASQTGTFEFLIIYYRKKGTIAEFT